MRLWQGVIGFFLRRVATSLFVIVGVVTAVFCVQRMIPGDPVDTLLGEYAAQSDRDALRHRLGLDRDLLEQYGALWGDLLDGSFGHSFALSATPTPVSSLIMDNLLPTIELALAGVLVAIVIAFPLGLFAASRRGTWGDHLASTVAVCGVALPNFWLGPLLLYWLAVRHTVFPAPGEDLAGLESLWLPALVLGTALAGKLTRMIRASVLDVMSAPHVIAARARGLSEFTIWTRYILRNAMNPVVTVMSLQLAALLTGAIVTEKVFARPGLGTLLLEGVLKRDYPVVQGSVIVIAAVFIVVNLLADLVYGALDPRVRLTSASSASGVHDSFAGGGNAV